MPGSYINKIVMIWVRVKLLSMEALLGRERGIQLTCFEV